MPADNFVSKTAKRWIGLHLGEHLYADRQRLIDRGAAALQRTFHLDAAQAEREMLHALAAVESDHSSVYIDLAHSTPCAVLLVDPDSGRTIAFTAGDLLAIARAAGALPRNSPIPAGGAQRVN